MCRGDLGAVISDACEAHAGGGAFKALRGYFAGGCCQHSGGCTALMGYTNYGLWLIAYRLEAHPLSSVKNRV